MASIEQIAPEKASFNGVLSLEQRLPRPEIMVPVLAGLFFGLIKIIGTLPHPWATTAASPDDLARMAQVRDLLDGQHWFDLLQTRLDPPQGVWMHWSRLVDAPIAGLTWLGDLFGSGEAFALMVWPLLLLVAFFVVIAGISRELTGDKGVFFAVFVTVFFESTLQAFRPGRLDHHNVQILLSALLILSIMRLSRDPRWGAAGGLFAALMIGVGIETLPFVAAGTATVAALWLWDSRGQARGACAFGLSFAASTALVFAASVPFSRYTIAQCDSISMAHLVPAVVGGTGLALITSFVRENSHWHTKASALALLGIACAAILVLAFPHCVGDPYAALDPRLREIWLSNVSEANGAFTVMVEKPFIFALNAAPLMVLAGILVFANLTTSGESRKKWAILSAFTVTGIVVCIIQVRFFQFTHILCIPAAAWVMSRAYENLQQGFTVKRAVVLIAVPLVASPWLIVLPKLALDGLAGEEPQITEEAPLPTGSNAMLACQDTTARAAFASVAPGVMASRIFFGSTVLGHSNHSVIAAPYHRGQAGILDAYEIFSSPPEQARAILTRRNADYLAFCPTNENRIITGEDYPGGLVATLEAGSPPEWLVPVDNEHGGYLQIFRVSTAGNASR
ncbi:hypothetical protein [Hoeflea sp.]|uniref:hypothetical protein n=1 Tax=Hoeflea sp. TaxID=1940281 RepID=UPI003B028117